MLQNSAENRLAFLTAELDARGHLSLFVLASATLTCKAGEKEHSLYIKWSTNGVHRLQELNLTPYLLVLHLRR